MSSRGQEALARLLASGWGRLSAGADPDDVAAKIWPDFKEAVAAAQSEARADELKGVENLQNARHAKP